MMGEPLIVQTPTASPRTETPQDGESLSLSWWGKFPIDLGVPPSCLGLEIPSGPRKFPPDLESPRAKNLWIQLGWNTVSSRTKNPVTGLRISESRFPGNPLWTLGVPSLKIEGPTESKPWISTLRPCERIGRSAAASRDVAPQKAGVRIQGGGHYHYYHDYH